MKCLMLRRISVVLLLAVSLSAKGQENVPPAIQTLKNAGLTVSSIGGGKWYAPVNGSARIFNDDGTVFGDFTSYISFEQNRMVVTKGTYTYEGSEPTEWIIARVKIYGEYIPVKKTYGSKREGCTVNTDWDILDEKGNSILKFPIDKATKFSEGLCAVKVDGKWGFIDLDGNMVCEPKFDNAFIFYGDYGLISDKYDRYAGIINKKFEIVLPVSKLLKVQFLEKEYKGYKGLVVVNESGEPRDIELLRKCYLANGRNLKKAIKEYDKKYRK